MPGDSTPGLKVDEMLSGPTTMVGRACIGDPAVPASSPAPTIDIAVVVRGLCTVTEKVANIETAGGWDAIVVVNREGADGCGAFGMTVQGGISTFSIDRATGYGLFDAPGYDGTACLAGAASDIPGATIGTVGDTATLRSFFDGWGYVRLFENHDGELNQLDAYAIPEATDPAYASGWGDLSVHEIATSHAQSDPA